MSQEYHQISEITPPTPCQSKIFLITTQDTKQIIKEANYNISQEFSILQKCENDHIIKPFKQLSSKTYSMEFCELGDINTGNPFKSTESLQSDFFQMCKSIEYLHSKEICHLDLKLSNFVRNSEGTIKLLDFGHACSSKNPIKSVRGTSEYNSHERQLRNYDGKKADIFSLGICLTALMVGKVPCSRNKEAFPNTFTFKTRPEAFWVGLEALTKKSHPDFPGLDSEAVKLIEEMVSQEPSNRPAIETVFSHSFFS